MIPLELISMAAGGIFGAVVKLIATKQQMEKDKHDMLMQQAGLVAEAREFSKQDAKFAWTRRTIALTLLAAVTSTIWAPLLPGTIAFIPEVIEGSSTSVLFGLFEIQEEIKQYIAVTGPTLMPIHFHSFAAVMGTYFGASIASR
jgi:hypothetical protein